MLVQAITSRSSGGNNRSASRSAAAGGAERRHRRPAAPAAAAPTGSDADTAVQAAEADGALERFTEFLTRHESELQPRTRQVQSSYHVELSHDI